MIESDIGEEARRYTRLEANYGMELTESCMSWEGWHIFYCRIGSPLEISAALWRDASSSGLCRLPGRILET